MSFFKNILGGGTTPESQKKNWKMIENPADLEEAVRLSYERKVVIFKHSTRCGVSRMALKKFENEMGLLKDAADFFFLDLLAHRDISAKIANDFKVVHQSPQIIVIKDGKTLASASHDAISATIV